MKSRLALLFCVLFALSVFFGCNGSEEETLPENSYTIENNTVTVATEPVFPVQRLNSVEVTREYEGTTTDYVYEYTYSEYNNLNMCDVYMDGVLYKTTSYSGTIEYPYLETFYEDSVQNDYVFEFDEVGNMTSKTLIEDGTETDRTEYLYDNLGNRSEELEYFGDTLVYHCTYAYDIDGNKTGMSVYNGDKVEYEYTYNENGKFKDYKYHRDDGTVYECTYNYVTDDYGNITEMTTVDDSGEVLSQVNITYEYDDNGNITAKTFEDVDYNIIVSFEYTYDEDGYISSFTREYDENGSVEKCTFNFNYDIIEAEQFIVDELDKLVDTITDRKLTVGESNIAGFEVFELD